MNHDSIDPKSLARMLDIEETNEREWRDEDIGTMLEHQLNAPLVGELKIPPSRRQDLERAKITTFAELLESDEPPLWALEETKNAMKVHLADESGPLRQVATLLYYAAIAAARVKCNARITELPDQDLAEGLDWATSQTWADARLIDLYTRAKH